MSIHRRHSELSPEQRRKANTRSYSNVLQRRGVLVKQPCEMCGSEDSQKHHEDYGDPRTVRWLCRGCHVAEHKSGPAHDSHTKKRSESLMRNRSALRDAERQAGWIVFVEASGKTGIAASTLRAWVAAKKVVSKKVGGIVFVGVSSLNEVTAGKSG